MRVMRGKKNKKIKVWKKRKGGFGGKSGVWNRQKERKDKKGKICIWSTPFPCEYSNWGPVNNGSMIYNC